RLAVEQPVDLDFGERHRFVAGADEPGYAGRVFDEPPGVVRQLHVDQDVAGHRPFLLRLFLPALFDSITLPVGATTCRTLRFWLIVWTRCSRLCLTLFSCPE